MPRRHVRSLRHRDGAVQPQLWPFGDHTSAGRQATDDPAGDFGSIRGRAGTPVPAVGLLLFAVMVAVARVASAR